MYREAYGRPQIPALKPQGFRTDTGHRILGEHLHYFMLRATSYELRAINTFILYFSKLYFLHAE